MADALVQKEKEKEITKKAVASGSSGFKTTSGSTNKKVVSSLESEKISKNVQKTDSTTTFNKEALLILREMNSNQTRTNDKIEKLSERVDALYAMPEYEDAEDDYENYDYDDIEQDHGGSGDQSLTATPVSGIANVQPSAAGSSVFKDLSAKFQLQDKVDSEVNNDLAEFVNNSFLNGISDEKVSDMLKDIHRPENCTALVKTRVNQGVWRLLTPQTTSEDARLKNLQNMVVKSVSNFTKMLDKGYQEMDSQMLDWGMNGIGLLGQVNRLLNNKRKVLHKQDLDSKYHHLCSPSLPYTDFLYGEDINKNVRDIQDMNKLGKIKPGPYSYGPRGRGTFRGRGGRGTVWRGRGRAMRCPDTPMTYSKNTRGGHRNFKK